MRFAELRRGYQIMAVFSAYRLDELLDPSLLNNQESSITSNSKSFNPWPARFRRSLFWIAKQHQDAPVGERLRLALQELGPVWIKLGQMLSTRRDLLPDHLSDPLAKLQDQVEPFDGELALAEIEKALGGKIDTWFDDFDITPLASASIAQVHTATLKVNDKDAEVTGQPNINKSVINKPLINKPIVIKIIRPDIAPKIHADLALMHRMASILMHWVKDSHRFRFTEVVEQYEQTLLAELDLRNEAANAQQLKANFANSPDLYVPEIIDQFTCDNVMVSERIYGIPISDIEALKQQGTDMKRLAEKGVSVFFTQAFRDSFFHADMHPGNVFVSKQHPEDPQWIGLDCGIIGKLNKEDQRYLAKNLLAFFNRDYRQVAILHVQSAWVPLDADIDAFTRELERVCDPMFNKPLGEISFGLVLLELFKIARQFKMDVQPQLVLLQKTLLYIEGLGRQLYPQLDLWTTAKPFLENWMNEQIGPKAIFESVKQKAPIWAEKLPELPELLFETLEKTRDLDSKTTQFFTQYCENKRKQTTGFFLFGMGATSLISAAILFSQSQPFSIGLSVVGILLWFASWRKLS